VTGVQNIGNYLFLELRQFLKLQVCPIVEPSCDIVSMYSVPIQQLMSTDDIRDYDLNTNSAQGVEGSEAEVENNNFDIDFIGFYYWKQCILQPLLEGLFAIDIT